MRVIAGSVKGRKLKAPVGLHTRPITDMIKEALFNVWGSDIYDSTVLDLFAGSGSVGIEALSRGACKVVFVDNDINSSKIIKENLNNCSLTTGWEVLHNDVFRVVELLSRHGQKFDYIYVDPPFSNVRIFNEIMLALGRADILEDDGVLVIRSQKQKEMAESFHRLVKYRQSNYGESNLHYYRWTKEDSIS